MKRLLQFNKGYILLYSMLLVLVITPLFQQGVFGDGILYLTVAFNRYRGYGSFWHQHFSDTSMSFFCEQPPLYFETLAWFYKLFGGAEVAEKIFTIVLLLLTILLINLIWKRLNGKGSRYTSLSWLPSLFAFSVSVFAWTYCNQVIETMVIPLALLVFYTHLVFIEEQTLYKKTLLFIFIIGLLFALLLTKGIQSTFVLAILFFAALSWKKKNVKSLLIQNVLLALGFGLLSFLFFFYNPAANFWLRSYFDKRIIATFNHIGATTDNHFEIIFRYLTEQIPLLVVLLLVMIYFKVKSNYPVSIFLKNGIRSSKVWWLVLISLSGVIPLALTLEQRGFYLTPTIPFIAIAFAFAYKRYFFVFFSRLNRNRVVITVVTYTILTGSLLFFVLLKNKYKYDEGMLKDISLLKTMVPSGETIGFDKSMWDMYSLRSYVKKTNNNDFLNSDTTRVYVLNKDNKAMPPEGYKKINCTTYWFDIYYKKPKELTLPP